MNKSIEVPVANDASARMRKAHQESKKIKLTNPGICTFLGDIDLNSIKDDGFDAIGVVIKNHLDLLYAKGLMPKTIACEMGACLGGRPDIDSDRDKKTHKTDVLALYLSFDLADYAGGNQPHE